MLNWITKQFLKTIIPIGLLIANNAFSQDDHSNDIKEPLENKVASTLPKNDPPVKKETKQLNTIKIFSPVDSARISSNYGVWRGNHRHAGIDLAAYFHKEVYAAQDGIVESARWKGGYGYRIVINHGFDDFGREIKTTYNHLAPQFKYVHEGDQVYAGDLISRVGKTGNIRGVHLHFEYLADNQTQDPTKFIQIGYKKVRGSKVLVRHEPNMTIEEMPAQEIQQIENYFASNINLTNREYKVIVENHVSRRELKRRFAELKSNMASTQELFAKTEEMEPVYMKPLHAESSEVEKYTINLPSTNSLIKEEELVAAITPKRILIEDVDITKLSDDELEALCPVPSVEILAKKKEELVSTIDKFFDSDETSKDSIQSITNKTLASGFTTGQDINRISKGYEKKTYQIENRLESLSAYTNNIDAQSLTDNDKEQIADTLVRLNENKYLNDKIAANENLKELKDTVQEKLINLVDAKTAGVQIAAYNSPEKNLTRVKNEIKSLYGYEASEDEIKHDIVDGLHKYTLLVGRSQEEVLDFARDNHGQGMYGLVSYENGQRKSEWKSIKKV